MRERGAERGREGQRGAERGRVRVREGQRSFIHHRTLVDATQIQHNSCTLQQHM